MLIISKKRIVRSETSDVTKAREALNGPEMSAMQEAGFIGPPKIRVME
jgi:hypothetical protein